MSEVLIKGGRVIDGTGRDRFDGDVLVRDGKIKAVGRRLGTTGEVINADGRVVCPGFIDPHTHLDAQLMFERRGTASSWHGVTTVLTGLCGYSFAPCKPEHQDYLVRMFTRVEEMPLRVLELGLNWTWTTFPQYLDSLDKGLGINVAPLIGHSAMRYYVMGPAARERKATADEIKSICGLVKGAVQAGAFGFSTSRAATKNDMEMRPVPSRMAGEEELLAMAQELAGVDAPMMALNAEGTFVGLTEADKSIIRRMVEINPKPIQTVAASRDTDFMKVIDGLGGTLWSPVSTQPFYRYVNLYQGTTTFNDMDTWLVIQDKPFEERKRMFADPKLRPQLRAELDAEPHLDPTKRRRPLLNWDILTVAKTQRPENRHLEGLSIREIAGRQGKHLADALLDLAVSEDLKTSFLVRMQPEAEWFNEAKAAMFRHPNVVPFNSDAGAHLRSECKAGDCTYFLRNWVMGRSAMSLEEGIRKITSLPASLIGLKDRGVLKEGAAADIVVLDPDRVNCLPKEVVTDFPGQEERWVQRSEGVGTVLVNGKVTIREGKEAGEMPGRVLRSTWYR